MGDDDKALLEDFQSWHRDLEWEHRDAPARRAVPGARNAALAAARNGDWEELARFIEDGGPVRGVEVRKFLAAVLRGEISRPNNRAPKVATQRRLLALAFLHSALRRRGLNAGQAEAEVIRLIDILRKQLDALQEAEAGRGRRH
jgi:hypothetical protein